MHRNGIVHRDLKPENILFDKIGSGAQLKITDFGISKSLTKGKRFVRPVGTSYYIAPEVLGGKYTEKCDLWSLGVVMYMMISGVPPFPGKNDKEIEERVLRGKYSLTYGKLAKLSEQGRKFMTRLMEVKVEKRATAQQALDDPWFQKMIHRRLTK